MQISLTLGLWKALAVGLLLLPAVLTASYAAVWWSRLGRPFTFFVFGAALLYVAYVAIGELLFVPAFDAIIFVPSTTAPTPSLAAPRSLAPFFRELAPTPLALLVVSYPLLRWVRSVLPTRTQDGAAHRA